MKPNKIYNKFMNGVRTTFLIVSALILAGSVVAVADGVKNHNVEQVVGGTALAVLSIATPAMADPNVKRYLRVAGFMGGGLSRTEEHLLAVLEEGGKLNQDSLAKYKTGRLRFVNADFFIAYNVTGTVGGIKVIMNELTTKAVGVSNIDKGKLPAGVNACIDTILVGFVNHATETDPSKLANYDSVVSSWPAALANGYLNIKVDGQLISDPIPLELCGSMADTTVGRGKVEGYQLKTPIFIPADTQISIEIEFANVAMAANQNVVKVWLLGSKTKNKSGY